MEVAIYVIVIILVVIIILGLIAPKNLAVNRSIIINKSRSETFQYLKLIKNQDHWSPWKNKDPNMEQSYVGTDGEVGFVSKWKGNKDVGEGEQEILSIIENESINSQLRFFKPWKSESIGHFELGKVDEEHTLVTWGFSGQNKFPFNIFMLFMNMDKTLGKDFEEGLVSLKEILEA